MARLATLTRPVHIQVFSTPTCVYCPRAVALAHRLAVASPLISATAYSVIEFPDLIRRHRVTGVPKIVVDHGAAAVSSCSGRNPKRRWSTPSCTSPRSCPESPMAAIEIRGVTKTFGTHVAVDDLSLGVADGLDLRLHRAERLGQDHDAADDHEHPPARPRRDRRARRARDGARRAIASATCRRSAASTAR